MKDARALYCLVACSIMLVPCAAYATPESECKAFADIVKKALELKKSGHPEKEANDLIKPDSDNPKAIGYLQMSIEAIYKDTDGEQVLQHALDSGNWEKGCISKAN